jgi:hypothetical protein
MAAAASVHAATATDEVAGNAGTYATTDVVRRSPAGSAIEFAVDYAAGTCRVAFYTPAAVSGGFVESPDATPVRFGALCERPFAPTNASNVKHTQ